MKFIQPTYVVDGQIVWLLWDREKGTGLKCQVLCAAGNRARVYNEIRKVDKWVGLDSLRVKAPEDLEEEDW